MAVRPILVFPDPLLRQTTKEVTFPLSDESRKLIADMIDTMYAADGAGLAAIQIGSDQRIFVVDGKVALGHEESKPVVFVNPRPVSLSKEEEAAEEGCLSFPGVFVLLKRSFRATFEAKSESGERFEVSGEGLYARALQHEIDHLDGRLLIDRVGMLERQRIRQRMKRERDAEAADAGDTSGANDSPRPSAPKRAAKAKAQKA